MEVTVKDKTDAELRAMLAEAKEKHTSLNEKFLVAADKYHALESTSRPGRGKAKKERDDLKAALTDEFMLIDAIQKEIIERFTAAL